MTTESDLQTALEANLLLIAENRRLRKDNNNFAFTVNNLLANVSWAEINSHALKDALDFIAKHGSQS